MKPVLYFGSDHAGLELKQYLIDAFSSDYECVDCGPQTFNKQDDYPDFAKAVCEKVLEHNARGVLVCDTGIGMSIAANRYAEIRASMVVTPFMAERTRLHNDSNVLCLGQELASHEESAVLLRIWLTTSFEDHERHIRRIQKLDMLG